jgi:hypothetical protein
MDNVAKSGTVSTFNSRTDNACKSSSNVLAAKESAAMRASM